MRVDNIIITKQVPNSHVTRELYIPGKMRYEDMPAEILLRALCPKNIMKDWHVCQACMSGCRAGNLLVAHMTSEPPRQQPVREKVPMENKNGRKPKTSTLARLTSAREAMLQGSSRNEAAKLCGYKNWGALREALKRHGMEPPPMNDKDKAKRKAYEAEKLDKAIQKCIEARRLVAQGMKREEAAKVLGYSCWNAVHNTYCRHKEEVIRRESAG